MQFLAAEIFHLESRLGIIHAIRGRRGRDVNRGLSGSGHDYDQAEDYR
jgi:hypothetical protein